MAKSKRKKGVSDKVRLAKTKQNALKKIGIEQRNPFEVKINRQKHKILGRKLKHDRGLPGVSRSKSTKKVGLYTLLYQVYSSKPIYTEFVYAVYVNVCYNTVHLNLFILFY